MAGIEVLEIILGSNYAKLQKIIEHYGEDNQLEKVKEELIELHTEIRLEQIGVKNEITDEMADVFIMLVQLMMILQIDIEALEERAGFKIDRQIKRIEDDVNERS